MPIPSSYTATNYQIILGTGAGTDITQLIIDWSLEQNPAAVGTPVTKTFSASIAANPAYASLNMSPTAALWKRGRLVRLYLDSELFATLRITRYDYDADDVADLARGQLEAACVLSRENYPRVQTPFGINWFEGALRETVLPGLTRSVVPWGLATDKFLRRAGLTLHNLDSLPTLLSRTFINGQPAIDGFTAEPPDPDASPINQAAAIAIGSGYWLTTDEQDRVIAVPYPINASNTSPVIRLPREVLHKFTLQRLETGDNFEPPEVVEVVGRTTREPDQADPSELDPDDIIDPDDPSQQDEEFQTQPCDEAEYGTIALSNGFLTTYPPRVSRGAALFEERKITLVSVLFPDIAGGGYVTEYSKITRTVYDGQGKATSSVEQLTQPLGLASPTLFPNNTSVRVTEIKNERWSYRAGAVNGKFVNGLLISHTINIARPKNIVLNDLNESSALILAEREEIRYFERGCDRWAKITSRFQRQRRESDNALVLVSVGNPDPEFLSAPPEPPYKPELAKPEPAFQVQDDEIQPDTLDPDEEPGRVTRKEIISIQAVNSTERAQDLTQLFTELFQGRRWARIIERALDSHTIQNFKLFEVEDLHNQRFIRDGFAIASAGGITVVSYTGQFVGDLAQPVTIPHRPVLVPTTVLTIGAIPNYAFTVGQAVDIPLAATGGVRPYVFDATPLPAGLSVVGDRIVGTVTTAATTNPTVTVVDDVMDDDSTGFTITVAAAPVARKRFVRVTRIDARQGQGGEWVEPPEPIVIEARQEQSVDILVVVFVPVEAQQSQNSDYEIGALPTQIDASQSQRAEWTDVLIHIESQQSQQSDYEIVEADLPEVVGWVAHAVGTSNQIFVGNIDGTSWAATTLSNGFASVSTFDSQTTDSSATWVMALGRDTSDSNRAITRCRTNVDRAEASNWTLHTSGLPATGSIYGLKWLFGSTWVASINNVIYRSTDDGQNWSSVFTFGSGTLRQIACSQNGSTVWVSTSLRSAIIRSDNGGATWTQTSFTQFFNSGNSIPTIAWSGLKLAVGRGVATQPNLAETTNTNADAGWSAIDTGIGSAPSNLHALGGTNSNVWIAALPISAPSIWVSTDDLDSFTGYDFGFTASGADSDGSLVLVSCGQGRIARSTDFTNWTVTQAVTGLAPGLLSITKVLN